MSLESLGVVVSLIIAVTGAAASWRTASVSARKSEIDALKAIIETLRVENERLEEDNIKLRERVLLLENIIRGKTPVPSELERRTTPRGLAKSQ